MTACREGAGGRSHHIDTSTSFRGQTADELDDKSSLLLNSTLNFNVNFQQVCRKQNSRWWVKSGERRSPRSH